jgi:hypothetical protein
MSCKDYSFGLPPRDAQLSNAKINGILSSCKDISGNNITFVSSAYLQASEFKIPVTPPIPLIFNRSIMANPDTFVAEPDGTFIIPVSGMWRIDVNLAITEYAGTGTGVIILLCRNGQTPETPNANLDTLGYVSIDTNQSSWVTGNILQDFNAGETIRVFVNQIFGNSPDVQVLSGVQNLIPQSPIINLSRISVELVTYVQ